MFERLENPKELFGYRMAEALKMEEMIHVMLDEQEQKAQSEEVKEILHRHAVETQTHVATMEDACTELFGDPAYKSSPAVQGLKMESKSSLHKAREGAMDAALLASAAETEHHEIAVYEDLIAHADALGEEQVASLLRQNLAEEEAMLGRVKAATERLAHEAAREAARA